MTTITLLLPIKNLKAAAAYLQPFNSLLTRSRYPNTLGRRSLGEHLRTTGGTIYSMKGLRTL
jgi:hypothetical protein